MSTGEWIEGDERRTLASIDAWDELPDYASVNLGEPAAPAVMETLRQRSIGIEAGLASIADAERLVKLDIGKRALRILSKSLSRTLARRSPSLTALLRRWTTPRCDGPSSCMASTPRSGTSLRSQRVGVVYPMGLEDGCELPDGTIASGNAALIIAAVEVYRSRKCA